MAKKDLQSLYKKYLEIKSPQGQNMADGGEVKDEHSTFQDLAYSFKKAFSAPKPKPSPTPTPDEKAEAIRQQSLKDFNDSTNNPSSQYYTPAKSSGGIVGTGRVTQYADGGEIGNPYQPPKPSPSPQSQEEKEAEAEEVTKREDERKLEKDEEAKPFNKGGKVEHNHKNLLELKAAFDKFINEESAEKMAS